MGKIHRWFNLILFVSQSLPFGGVKDSGFGRFAGIEGLRACCLVKSVVEDRWWPLVKTKIPKPIQVKIQKQIFLKKKLIFWPHLDFFVYLSMHSTPSQRTALSFKNRSWKHCTV